MKQIAHFLERRKLRHFFTLLSAPQAMGGFGVPHANAGTRHPANGTQHPEPRHELARTDTT